MAHSIGVATVALNAPCTRACSGIRRGIQEVGVGVTVAVAGLTPSAELWTVNVKTALLPHW